MKKKIIIINLLLFIILLSIYLIKKEFIIDTTIYKVITYYKSNTLTNIMRFITFLASTKFIVFIMIILLILSLFKLKIPYYINITILGEVVLNRCVKLLVRRPRPIGISLVKETGFSFPSGHTMVSIVLYGFLIYLIYKSNINKYIKICLIILLCLLIILVMISRIYLGVHYFTDCIGGYLLASSYLLIIISILERKKLC